MTDQKWYEVLGLKLYVSDFHFYFLSIHIIHSHKTLLSNDQDYDFKNIKHTQSLSFCLCEEGVIDIDIDNNL